MSLPATAASEHRSVPETGLGPSARRATVDAKVVGWSLTMVGLCLFAATIVTTRLPLGWPGIAIAIVGLILERPRIEVPQAARLYGLFLLWAFIGSFFALDPEIARGELLERLKLAVIFVVAINALRTPAQVRFFLLLVLFCFMIYPARGTLRNYFLVHYTSFGRAIWNAGYANPNDLGVLCDLALGVALAIGLNGAEKRYLRRLCVLTSCVLLFVIFLTQSRGAFIGLAVGIGSGLGLLALRGGRNILLASLALGLLAFAVPSKVWQRLGGISELTSAAGIAEADPEGSAAQRLEIQKTAWRIATDHPVFGVGLGCYGIANQIYAPELGARDTHNTYFNLWAEAGLPGLLIWLRFVYLTLRNFRRHARAGPARWSGMQLAWIERAVFGTLVSGLFGSYANLTLLYLLLGVLACRGVLGDPAVAPLHGPAGRR